MTPDEPSAQQKRWTWNLGGFGVGRASEERNASARRKCPRTFPHNASKSKLWEQMPARPTPRLVMETASYTDREACSQVAQPWRPQEAMVPSF